MSTPTGRTVSAAVITAHGHPPHPAPYVLPAPAAGQALLDVTAAPIAPLDLLCASGTSYFGPPALPYVPGVQGVGVVRQGDALAAGSRLWFNTDAGMRPGDGSIAEAAVVDEAQTVPVPEGVDDALAAALGLSAVAAWMSLTWRAQLREGERVLVLGAGGAVGQVAVQAAVALGAGSVVAASRREAARSRSLAHGATAVVDLSDADVEELESRIRDAVGGPVDVVIDPVCGAASTAALRVLADAGRLVQLGASGGPSATFSSAALRSGSHSILGYTNNSLSLDQRADALAQVFALAAQDRCHVEHETIALHEVADGWARTAASPDRRVVICPTGHATLTKPGAQPDSVGRD